jgi:WD40 repeat protein
MKLWDIEKKKKICTLLAWEADPMVNQIPILKRNKSFKIKEAKRKIEKAKRILCALFNRKILTTNHLNEVSSISITPDGRKALSGSSCGILRLWDLEAGKELFVFPEYGSLSFSMAFTLDSKKALVSGTRVMTDKGDGVWVEEMSLKLLDLETRQKLFDLENFESFRQRLAITPDGKKAISSSFAYPQNIPVPINHSIPKKTDNLLNFWDLETGAKIFSFVAHKDVVNGIVINSANKTVITCSNDITIKLWDLDTSKHLATFIAESALTCCDISRDGFTLVAGESSGRVHFLRLEGGI